MKIGGSRRNPNQNAFDTNLDSLYPKYGNNQQDFSKPDKYNLVNSFLTTSLEKLSKSKFRQL